MRNGAEVRKSALNNQCLVFIRTVQRRGTEESGEIERKRMGKIEITRVLYGVKKQPNCRGEIRKDIKGR